MKALSAELNLAPIGLRFGRIFSKGRPAETNAADGNYAKDEPDIYRKIYVS
jgi:hypothetical protein